MPGVGGGELMGYVLSNEVLDNAPADLTPAERLVLSVLAGYVQNEATRECYPGMASLVRRTGLKPDTLRRVFQRLAGRGLDPRVPIGIDKRGRKVFAHESVKTTYRIPHFESRDESPATEEGSESRHSPRGGTTGPQRRDQRPALKVLKELKKISRPPRPRWTLQPLPQRARERSRLRPEDRQRHSGPFAPVASFRHRKSWRSSPG